MTGVTYLPADTTPRHRFLIESVRARAGRFPYRGEAPRDLEEMVRAEARESDAISRVIVLPDDPDVFLGCFVVRPGLVVHAFTKPFLQKSEHKVMSSALRQHGFDFAAPTPVLVWSAVATRIAAGGKYRIFPAIPVGPCR